MTADMADYPCNCPCKNLVVNREKDKKYNRLQMTVKRFSRLFYISFDDRRLKTNFSI